MSRAFQIIGGVLFILALGAVGAVLLADFLGVLVR